MITHITVDRDCVSTRALHVKRLKAAASWRKQAILALRSGNRAWAHRAMAYTCQCVDEAARYRMDHAAKMELPR